MLTLNMVLKTKEKLNKFSISHFKVYDINFIEKKSTLDISSSRNTDGWKPICSKILPWEGIHSMSCLHFHDGYVLAEG